MSEIVAVPNRCYHCGQRIRVTPKAPPRKIRCWACGDEFTQEGPGRRRVVCDKKQCQAKRRHFQREGGALLDRWDEPEPIGNTGFAPAKVA